jgi:hypothetical protein
MTPTKYDAHFKLSRLTDRTLGHLLDCLTLINEEILEADPSIPLVYDSGVKYHHDQRDDPWADVLAVLAAWLKWQATGKPEIIDCEDLVCWRVAELRVRFRERNARPVFTRERVMTPEGPRQMIHILVQRGNGQIEDISRNLGMGQPKNGGLLQVLASMRST